LTFEVAGATEAAGAFPWDAAEAGPPRPDALGMSPDDLKALFLGMGEAAYRAEQAFEGLHGHGWRAWGDSTNLPKGLRARLEESLPVRRPETVGSLASQDGSTKHAMRLADGAEVECVHLPYLDRATLCLSSQAGCAFGCAFCATGAAGLARSLTAAEMVGQAEELLFLHPRARRPNDQPTNIVFMGMGEPLHNFGAVMAAFDIMTHPKGLAVPPRRVALSTVGHVPGIEALARRRPRPRLAVSLNATTDEARSKVMPANAAWGLGALLGALCSFPLEKNERITLEYVVIKGVSDSMEDAARLSAFAARFPSKINLIPHNPWPGSGLAAPDEDRLDAMGALLAAAGRAVAVRRSRGADVQGACGQLSQLQNAVLQLQRSW
jgi:23S rRNA (adenine2503-C2)-methyltransferase